MKKWATACSQTIGYTDEYVREQSTAPYLIPDGRESLGELWVTGLSVRDTRSPDSNMWTILEEFKFKSPAPAVAS